MGVEKGFVITDTNNDGIIGGADFGFYIDPSNGHPMSNPTAMPFTGAKAKTLSDDIYKTQIVQGGKSIILLGESHGSHGSDVAINLITKATANKKKVTFAYEMPTQYFDTVVAKLNKIKPEDLKKDEIRNPIYGELLQAAVTMWTGLTGVAPTQAQALAEPTFHDIQNMINARASGAKIAVFDTVSAAADINTQAREDGIVKNLEALIKPGELLICETGHAHAAKSSKSTALTENGRGSIKNAYQQLNEMHKGKVASILLAPDVADVSPEAGTYIDTAIYFSGQDHASGEIRGGYLATDFDRAYYYDWR